MGRVCRACGADTGDGAQFCSACGAPQVAESKSGERRQLTVMFCDLVDSTGISGRLDPEDFRDLVRSYQDVAALSIRRHGGRVANFLGDGVLAYFGYPLAHDDDARRAVMASLDIVRRVVGLEAGDLATRIAVHTGPVVIAEMGSESRRLTDHVVGLTPNVAARLQDHADPNTVIVSGSTATLVGGYFRMEPLGSFALKGVDGLIDAYRPEASLAAVSRFDLSSARGLTPLAGRDSELAILADRWMSAIGGEPGTLLLVGEPGVGKTRLLREFRLRLSDREHDFVELRCAALDATLPLHPVLQHLRGRLARDDGSFEPQDATGRLRALIENADVPMQPTLALIGGMLGLAAEDDQPQLAEGVELRRELALQALRELLVAGPAERPLLVVVEDLQWADPSTLALVGSFTEMATARPLTVLCTARTEFCTPWTERADVQLLALQRLDPQSAQEVAAWVMRDRDVSHRVVDAIVERSDGIPLFIEEIARLAGSEGVGASTATTAIPATLHDLLVGRVDRLGETKDVLQRASVIGREFELDLLTAIEDDRDSARLLELLDSTDLITDIPGPDRVVFAFRHSLIRDAAYSTLLRSERRALHERVARVLMHQQTGASDSSATPDVVAYHCAEGGLIAEAIEEYHKAANVAMAGGANDEALTFVDRALRLMQDIPAGPDRAALELMLLTARGPALMAQLGYGHPAVSQTFGRAKELCDELGDPIEIFPVLYGLVAFSAVRCELDTASELCKRLVTSAARANDDGLVMLAHAASAQTLFIGGHFKPALEHARECAAHHDPIAQAEYRILFGEDPGIVCRGVESWLLWLLGRPEEAVAAIERTLAAARSLCHRFTLAETLLIAARLRHYMRDTGGVRRAAGEARAIATEHGFPLFTAEAAFWTGWADAMEGADGEAPERLRSGLDAYRLSGAQMFVPHHLVLLAEALWRHGRAGEALEALSEAQEQAVTLGNLDHHVEALRLTAAIVAERDPRDADIVPLLDHAAALAREQGALSLGVRVAATRLRLAREAAEPRAIEEARRGLAAACRELPDGARSSELEEARGLVASATHPSHTD